MFRKYLSLIAILIISSGCSFNINKNIDSKLKPNQLNSYLRTKKFNLAEGGLCSNITLSVCPVNNELRHDKYVVGWDGPFIHYLEPKEFIAKAVEYLKIKLVESNLKIDKNSEEKIFVSLEEAISDIIWATETTIKLKIELPKINYSRIYVGTEEGTNQLDATSYALHLSIHEFLNDPVFQNYVKCK